MPTETFLELASSDADVRGRVEANLQSAVVAISHDLARAQATGDLTADRDPQALARYLVNALQGLRVIAKVTDNLETLEDITRVTLSVLDSLFSFFCPISGTTGYSRNRASKRGLP